MSSSGTPEFFVPPSNDEADLGWFHQHALADAEHRGGVVNRRIYRLDYRLGERELRAEVGKLGEVDGGETERARIGAIFETPKSYFIYGRLYGAREVAIEDASEAVPFKNG